MGKGSKPTEDNRSVLSKFSAFSVGADAARTLIVRKGYLSISDTTDPNNPVAFVNTYCTLSKDGRLNTSKAAGSPEERYIIMSCSVVDTDMFRLLVKCETNLLVEKNIEQQEFTIRAKNDHESCEWLIAIEGTLRTRLQTYKNELDCARGLFNVKEIGENEKPSQDNMKMCSCFYYESKLRIKGIDGTFTSNFVVQKIETNPVELPMCIIIYTPGRTLLFDLADLDQFQKWTYAIGKDLDRKATVAGRQALPTVDIVTAEFLMGPTAQNMVRFQAKYYVADRLLETRDYAGNVDSFFVERGVLPPQLGNPVMPVPDKFNYILMLNSKEETIKERAEQFFVQFTEIDLKAWSPLFHVDMFQASMIMEVAVMQIEMLRMMHSAHATINKDKKSLRNQHEVSARDVWHFLSSQRKDVEAILQKSDEWPVVRLERIIQLLMKFPPEAIVPLNNVDGFLRLGKELMLAMNKSPSSLANHFPPVMALITKLPNIRREILEKLTVHIFRLTRYYDQNKEMENAQKAVAKAALETEFSQNEVNESAPEPKDAAAGKKTEAASKSATKAKEAKNQSNSKQPSSKELLASVKKSKYYQELMVWVRLSKYIFRLYEHLPSNKVDHIMPFAAAVLLVFQKKFIKAAAEQLQSPDDSARKKGALAKITSKVTKGKALSDDDDKQDCNVQ